MDKETKQDAKIVEVPTQTAQVFQVGDKLMSQMELMLEMYKDIQSLKKLIA